MSNPTILTIDDDPAVLRAVERDLKRQYAGDYRILRAESGAAAMGLLRRLKERGDPVALLVVDQRMPQLDGVGFLEQAMNLYPDARRVLLTAYADTDAAIAAINRVQIHHYLLKPWDPPEQHLYPVLDDLLEDWQASFHPPFQGVRVVGNRWTPRSHEIRDFLARYHVPYRWFDIEAKERDEEARQLIEALNTDDLAALPLVIFPDGVKLREPSLGEIAARLGLHTQAETAFYDLVIVGSGPAGLAAAVYGASEGLRTVIVEREAPGGQAAQSSRIENYLGFPAGLTGADLARRAVAQAKRFGVEILAPQETTRLQIDGPYRIVTLADGSSISCHALLIASGVRWRKLNVPGLERLYGAGVYYGAAMTEALSCRNEVVYVIGGANSAGQAAIHFSRFASKVIMLVRAPSLAKSMSKYLVDQIKNTPNVEVCLQCTLAEAHGETRLEAITVLNERTGQMQQMSANSLFIFIGAEPHTEWLDGMVERDERGFILSGPDLIKNGQRPKGWMLDRDPALLETSMPGVFVVGDVRHGSIKRVASAVGEGSIAVQFIHQYLSKV